MGIKLLKLIKVAEICHGKKAVTEALNITTYDIKFNKLWSKP